MKFPRKKKGPKTLVDKVREIDSAFADEVYSMTDEGLRNRVITTSKEDLEIEAAKKDDMDLLSLKEQVKVASETYTEPMKANKLRRKLALQVLGERGKL